MPYCWWANKMLEMRQIGLRRNILCFEKKVVFKGGKMKTLKSYFSLVKTLKEQENILKEFVEKNTYWENNDVDKENKTLIRIVKEFPNSTLMEIVRIATLIGFPKTTNYIGRRIWALIDNGTLKWDHVGITCRRKNDKI